MICTGLAFGAFGDRKFFFRTTSLGRVREMERFMRLWFLASAGVLFLYVGWSSGHFGFNWMLAVACAIVFTVVCLSIPKGKTKKAKRVRRTRLALAFASFSLLLLVGMFVARARWWGNEWLENSVVKLDSEIRPVRVFDEKSGALPIDPAVKRRLEKTYAQLQVAPHAFPGKMLVAFDKLGLAIIEGQRITPVYASGVILSAVLPDDSFVYVDYLRGGRGPQVLRRAVVRNGIMVKLWERSVADFGLHHWGDTFDGDLYQPARDYKNLPDGISRKIGGSYATCKQADAFNDTVLVVDLETGQYKRRIDLLPILASMGAGGADIRKSIWNCEDPLHLNRVQIVKNEAQARAFPDGKIGDLLVSFRNINTVMLLDRDSLRVKWFVKDLTIRQHDPTITDRGTVILFDNQGSDVEGGRSRLLEIDTKTRTVAGVYEGTTGNHFESTIRGNVIVTDQGLLVLEEYPDPGLDATMFTLTCPGGAVSGACVKTLIFRGKTPTFTYANVALLQ